MQVLESQTTAEPACSDLFPVYACGAGRDAGLWSLGLETCDRVLWISLDFSLDLLLVEKEQHSVSDLHLHTQSRGRHLLRAGGRDSPASLGEKHTHKCTQSHTHMHTDTSHADKYTPKHTLALIQSSARTLIPSDFYSLLVLI